tara:strand:- start:2931 stop:3554 length:624 start_codon:yes stop_codon:yes gene_type:complete
MSNALIIFIKNPELGKVKTRLASSIGDEKALKVYKILLERTKEIVLRVNSKRFLYYSNSIQDSDGWGTAFFSKQIQDRGDLGERMKDAFKKAFLEGSSKVLIVGSDCYDLSSDIIELAFKSLEQKDTVIGPANDGGYYLLGMKGFIPEIFEDIEWSTSTVFDETVRKLKDLKQSVNILPELIDIDELSDLQASGFDHTLIDLINTPH